VKTGPRCARLVGRALPHAIPQTTPRSTSPPAGAVDPLHVPVVLIADAFVVLGLLIVFSVFRENSYAASTVRVEANHQVITTGPYARIRSDNGDSVHYPVDADYPLPVLDNFHAFGPHAIDNAGNTQVVNVRLDGQRRPRATPRLAKAHRASWPSGGRTVSRRSHASGAAAWASCIACTIRSSALRSR